MTDQPTKKATPWYASPWIVFAAGLVLFACIVYREALAPGRLILTTDDNIGALAMRQRGMPFSFMGSWDDSALVGYPLLTYLNWTNLLLWLLPLNFFNNWIHAIDLVAASFCLGRFLRLRGLSFPAIAMGCLSAVWVGSTFFLTYAGHIGKFGTVVFAAACLWMIEKAVLTRRLPYAILAGGAMGGMFLEQADVALFFAMPLGLYAIYAAVRECGRDMKALVRLVAPLVAVAGVIAIHPMVSSIKLLALDGAQEAEKESPEEQWNYCTQWSWPPDEAIEFIAPGYMGWRSGEPDGPYWGRMGQSAEWPATKQGFRNFKLETMYMGAVPVVLALLAFIVMIRQRKDLPVQPGEVLFWTAALAVTYLLALGKYFPLYRIFYLLPGISSIRNPVKFLQVTQFAFAILAAFGVEILVRRSAEWAQGGDGKRLLKRFAFGVLVVGALFGLWAAGSASPAAISRYQADGWGDGAAVIVKNISSALSHASVVTVLTGIGLLVLARIRLEIPGGIASKIAWGLVLVAALDQLVVSPRYVKTVDGKGFVAENDVVKFLKDQLGYQRPYMLVQAEFYGLWLTYLFPYHGIPAFNVTQMRMPEDYKQFLGRVGNQPLKMWRMAAISYVMGPGPYLGQLQRDASSQGKFDVAFAFNAFGEPGGGVLAVAGSQQRPGEHGIMRYRDAGQRFQLIAGWENVEPEQAIERISAADYVPLNKVLLSGPGSESQPASTGEGPVGSVEVESYRAGKMVLRVSTDHKAILRVADKYEKWWSATLDGKPLPVFRCDYLFIGIPVEPGMHTITVQYKPSLTTFWSQVLGMILCVGALAMVLVRRR